jgi:hypothetical protein
MIVQVIKGRTSDPDAMLRRSQAWAEDVQPGAPQLS